MPPSPTQRHTNDYPLYHVYARAKDCIEFFTYSLCLAYLLCLVQDNHINLKS